MNYILLSGGSGTRLWPLSNHIRSKQFIRVFQRENGIYESMLQRVYQQIKKADSEANIIIATAKAQVSSILNQLEEDVEISIEPCRKDTFPAIVLACEYLTGRLGVDKEEAVIVCPIDPYVDGGYFEALRELPDVLQKKQVNLALLGIQPTYPSEKYGYILPESDEKISRILEFKEKPSMETAQKYIAAGGLWNAGVFAFKIDYMDRRAHERIDFRDYDDLFLNYSSLEKISFDYAVAEKEQRMEVLRYNGEWKDLGTWNTLTEAMEEDRIGNAVMDGHCENVHIINELSIPVLAMGLKDVVVSSSPDGILVSDKAQSSYIKPYVESMRQQVMYAQKSWGEYRVLDVGEESLTIKITLHAGHQMNYHSHEYRDEVWNVVSGTGRVVVDGSEKSCGIGDVIQLPAGCRHTVIAESDLQMIEVQTGQGISVEDKVKYPLE